MRIKLVKTFCEDVDPNDATITSSPPEEQEPAGQQSPTETLKARGYELTKLLGQGMYGKVYAAYDPDDKEVAVKIVSPESAGGENAVDRELSNYWVMQKAREQSKLVAKHFPEVYEKPFKENKYGFIVMEMLDSGGDESIEISDLFGGSEGVIPAERDLVVHGAYKDLSRRLFAFFDDTSKRNAFVNNLFKGINIDSIQDQPTKDSLEKSLSDMKAVADLWRGRYDATRKKESREMYLRSVAKMENLIPFQHQNLVMDFETKKELTSNLWLYYTFLKMLQVLKNNVDEYVYESYVGTVTENFINLIRRTSPIPVHNRPEKRRQKSAGAPEEMAGISDQARSLRAALEEAEKITGLAARDMHDQNAMFRPLGGDIVIVDLGLFKPRSQIRAEGKKWSQKERSKRRKGCANPKGFTMKQFCKNQKTKSKKGERKNENLQSKKISLKIKKSLREREKRKENFDLKLPRGKEVVLKAEDKDYDRGLVVKLLDDGGYDVYYWYENPDDVYPAEIKVDNKVVKKDGKIVHIGFHPELKKEARDPKKGTGKKPKGSGRRLYTDEDPSDTVSVSFKSVSAIKKTLAKSSFKSKSHKRQSQIINLIHQRSRAAYKNAKDPKVKARLKKAFNYATKRKEASKKKTIQKRKGKK